MNPAKREPTSYRANPPADATSSLAGQPMGQWDRRAIYCDLRKYLRVNLGGATGLQQSGFIYSLRASVNGRGGQQIEPRVGYMFCREPANAV
jgi:hypothetical protein